MKKIVYIVICSIVVISFASFVYARNDDECACSNQNLSVAEAIKGEMGDVFDSGDAFAAGGANFMNNLPNNPTGPGKVSSVDITLNSEIPAAPKPWANESGPSNTPGGGKFQEAVPGDTIIPPQEIRKD